MKKIIFTIVALIVSTCVYAKDVKALPAIISYLLSSDSIKADYYVSKSGNDNYIGNETHPFKTITKAIKTLNGGGIIVVRDGDYKEYVNIKQSGTKTKPLEIIAQTKTKAKVLGFRILHSNDYIRINGFEIESDMNYPNDKKGIMNYGGSHVEISDCYIHDCPNGGIEIMKNSPYTLIKNNKIEHNGFYGIYLDGYGGIIEDNTISKIVQNHPKLNPSEIPSGADADGIVIFGGNHTIRHNKILDLAQPYEENTNPHSDGIQSSSKSSNTVLQNSKIYGNYIRISYKSGKGVILESKNNSEPCKNIVIANNIIEFTDIGISASDIGGYENIKIYNNIFKSNLNQTSWGAGVWLKNISNYEFINNITIDCKNEHRKIVGGHGNISHNIAYNSDNSHFSMTPPKQPSEMIENPNFVNYTGTHGHNDYHLKSNSPAINKGQTLTGSEAVTKDYDNKNRPINSFWDIGAYER